MYVKDEHKPCMYLDILVCTLDDDMIVENKVDVAYVCRLRSGLIDDTKVKLNCNDTASEFMRCNNVDNEVMTVIMGCKGY